MKIRGNTVGTPIKPEKAIVRCENLTEEEQAKARENIGAISNDLAGKALFNVNAVRLGTAMDTYTDLKVLGKNSAGNPQVIFQTIFGGNPVLTGLSPGLDGTDAVNKAQLDDLGKSTSQGRSANYACYTPGWKRVLVTTRGHGGIVTFHTGKNRGQSRVFQNVAIMYSGFVNYPTNDYGSGWGNYRTDFDQKPAIYQLYNNIFGENTELYPDRKVEITKVRLGYPVPGTTYKKEDGTEAKLTNPVKCYVDVYLDFDADKVVAPSGTGVGLVMNYSGRSVDYDTLPILEETDATDVGLMGEQLQFTEFELDRGECISAPSAYISYLRAQKLMVEETMEISGLYVEGSADCEYLRARNTIFDDMPFKKIVGTAEKPIILRGLTDGIYYLSGSFFHYDGDTKLGSLSKGLYVVNRGASTSEVMRLTPVTFKDGHSIRYYTINNDSYTAEEISLTTIKSDIADIKKRLTALEG